jgi:hypothetical protein
LVPGGTRHEPDRVLDVRIDERDGPYLGRQRMGEQPRVGRHAGQARAGVADQGRHRVGLDHRARGLAGGGEGRVDDPPVLHVGRQEAERELSGPGPGDRRRAEALAGADEVVVLTPQLERPDLLQRLVVEVRQAGVELAGAQPGGDLT